MRLLRALGELERERGWLDDAALGALAEREGVPLHRIEELVSFYPHFRRTPPPGVEVLLCRDLSCHLAGAPRLHALLRADLGDAPGVDLREASCLGRCDAAPAATIDGVPVRCSDVAATARLVRDPAGRRPQAEPVEPRRFRIDPYPSERERYGTLRALSADAGGAERVLGELKASGLRGLGGAGFPTAAKWELVQKEAAAPKFVVCNADESEPGTFKDRVLLEEAPHLVVEGIAIAARTVGAREAIVFIRHEYDREREALAREIDRARGARALDGLDLDVFVSPGGYILGEETALIEALEDRRGEPRNKPPFPGTVGYRGKPTLINNVETLAMVPGIIARGSAWWRAQGVRGAAGLKLMAVSGAVRRPGVYEVPFGTTLRELLDLAGGATGPVRALLPGGASSSFLGPDRLDTSIDFATLAAAGSMLGSGALVVLCEGTNVVEAGINIARFFRNESCGKCVPCRVGTEKAVLLLEEAHAGRAPKGALELLPLLGETLRETSICGLGQIALGPVLSALERFGEDLGKTPGDR